MDSRAWAVLVLPRSTKRGIRTSLPNLEVDPHVELQLVADDVSEETVTAATIRARIESAAAKSAFSIVAAGLLEQVRSAKSFDYSTQIAGLRDIFGSLNRGPTATDIVGLWGELYVIAQGKDTQRLAKAWHSDPKEVFDFSSGNERLEVKTTRDPARAHWFSLAQSRASERAQVLVVSLVVSPSSDGDSLADLLNLITTKLDAAEAERVIRICAATLGPDLESAPDRFDTESARRSIKPVQFKDVPAIKPDARLLDARWRCSLADVEKADARPLLETFELEQMTE